MTISFSMTSAPCTIESFAFKKRGAEASNASHSTKKMKIFVLAEKEVLSSVSGFFAGLIDEHTLQRVANEAGPGFEVRSKKKMGVCNLSLHAPDGSLLFKDPVAKLDLPRLVVGASAGTSWLVFDAECSIPREAVLVANDYFKAEATITIGTAQTDIEDIAPQLETARTKIRRRKKPAEQATQVEWVAES